MPHHISEKVAEKITRCAEKQTRSLNLRECNLEEIPAEVFELTHLEILDLGNYKEVRSNHIKEVPAEISRLINLRHLDLARNYVEYLPDNINQLTQLQDINLDNNRLKSLPQKLDNLTNLTKLELNDNIDLKILPKSITHLSSLRRLKINNCGITEFPTLLLSLTNLTHLEINYNLIESIPTEIFQLINLKELYISHNRLHSVAPETFFMPSLETIHLEGNLLDDPPEEIIHQGLSALRNYYKQLYSAQKTTEEENVKTEEKTVAEFNTQSEQLSGNVSEIQQLFKSKELPETEYLNEIKLLLVGEGRVGKTTLAKALRIPDYQLEHESSTEGIDINKWVIAKEEFSGDRGLRGDFRLNVWDFGGQEIYYSTHQFFLTRRSIYLFVTESRKEDSHDTFFYWLNIIKLLGDSSPVILVLNKTDQPTKELPVADYKARFPNIVDFKKVSSHPDYRDTINTLKEEIKRIITNQNLLPQIGIPLPKVWIDIRKEIEALQQEGKNYISYETYLDICERHHMTEENAGFLSRFFHDLGVFLHFGDDLELANTIFLNHEWVTKGVYQVLDNQKVKDNKGKFSDKDLMDIWKDRKYRSKQQELLALMKNQKFEICFALPGKGKTKSYLAPQLLPADAPQDKLDKLFPPRPDYLRFEYVYPFMPKGILTRFIVKRNPDIYKSTYWLYGVVLYHEETYALIRELYIEKKIAIILHGKHKKELLSIIRKTLQEIHDDFHNLSVEEMIPCNCSECSTHSTIYFYRFAALKRRLDKGRKKVECDLSFEEVAISDLLEGVGNVPMVSLDNVEKFIAKNQVDNALDALLDYAKQQDDEVLERKTLGLLANWRNNEDAYIDQRISTDVYTTQRGSLLHQITTVVTER